jgi:cyclopropane-fatty-acyl-phospholipid synthase
MNSSSPTCSPAAAEASATGISSAPRPSWWRKRVLSTLTALTRGRLELHLPEGQTLTFGTETDQTAAKIFLRSEEFFTRCGLYGDIGFAEAYLEGQWDTPDLTAVIAWFIRNQDLAPTLSGSARSGTLNLLRGANRLAHLLRPNSRSRARRNIGAHYDLSNEFFALFLDPSMMYSAAKWSSPAQSLEEAQTAKNDLLCQKLRLAPGDHVLEIGTGWGGWALHAVKHYACQVTTVTISQQQYDLARRRVEEAGLTSQITVELRDYRDITQQYDKIVSIEMMEAIGHEYLPAFCAAIHRALRPNGVVALQFITCPDTRYEQLRRGVDFIQKHIFPGSLLLSLHRVGGEMAHAGDFLLHHLEDLGLDYARTLRHWRERFGRVHSDVRRLGFDDRFIRKWHYYLSYCEAAFAQRHISVVHAVFTRPNNPALGADFA